MPTKIQFRRDPAALWTSNNPVLMAGELGLELDTMAYKIGDGSSDWNSLPYRGLAPSLTTAIFDAIEDPSAPAPDTLLIYAKNVGGRMMLKQKGPAGVDTPLQPAIFSNAVQMIAPATSTAFSAFGQALPTAVGTVSHPTLVAGSQRQQTRRGILTSAATANAASELRNSVATVSRGVSPGLGGFFVTIRFGISSLTANQRVFCGLSSTTGAFATTTNPSALTNMIGVGWESTDTTLQIMHNDASGTATKVDLGALFPANEPDAIYELTLFAKPNDTEVSWRVVRLDTGDAAVGVITSSDIPIGSLFLTWHLHVNNGGTAASVVLEVYRVYIETDY